MESNLVSKYFCGMFRYQAISNDHYFYGLSWLIAGAAATDDLEYKYLTIKRSVPIYF